MISRPFNLIACLTGTTVKMSPNCKVILWNPDNRQEAGIICGQGQNKRAYQDPVDAPRQSN